MLILYSGSSWVFYLKIENKMFYLNVGIILLSLNQLATFDASLLRNLPSSVMLCRIDRLVSFANRIYCSNYY